MQDSAYELVDSAAASFELWDGTTMPLALRPFSPPQKATSCAQMPRVPAVFPDPALIGLQYVREARYAVLLSFLLPQAVAATGIYVRALHIM